MAIKIHFGVGIEPSFSTGGKEETFGFLRQAQALLGMWVGSISMSISLIG
jgi:hypothetical protein